MRLVCTVQTASEPVDVVIQSDPDATVSQLRLALRAGLGEVAQGGLWHGDRLLDEASTVSQSGVGPGAVLAFGGPADSATSRVADQGWQLHVVSGPDAGTIVDLPIGVHVLGRADGVQIKDAAISRRHALVTVGTEGATVQDLGSANGTLLDGVPVPVEGDAPLSFAPGQVLHLGDSLVTIRVADRSRAATTRAADGTVELTRPPRIQPPRRALRITVPQEPAKHAARKIPVVAMLAPAVMGVVMAIVMNAPQYLMFALASPVMAGANYVSQRRQGSKDAKQQWADYVAELERARGRVQDSTEAETADRRERHPDAARVLLMATKPEGRLWERRPVDPDFLDLRVGSAHQQAGFEISKGGGDVEHPTLPDVPAVVALGQAGVLGVAGSADVLDGLARWQVAQVAALHSPRDVRMVVLCEESASEAWQWVRWLPHVAGTDEGEPVALVGNDAETMAARVGELVQLVKTRTSVASAQGNAQKMLPATIVILAGAQALRSVPGVKQLLTDGPAVGVHSICLESEERRLPEECRAVVVADPHEPGRVSVRTSDAAVLDKVLADQVSTAYVARLARAVAPLRDRGRDDGDAGLPGSARLLDLLGMEDPTATAVQASWALDGNRTDFVVGAGIGGPFRLDLRADGPHGLIAGTTGSGKSELLQTIVASLAVANRPDAMNFVLVDYKGGSAFEQCVDLPHTVGMVTDLDAHLVQRALTSLGAELHYRETQLARIGAKNIEDYTELQQRDGLVGPLPRLVLVIDEFASMVRDLPDFVAGLVNIAQRGRSLGIHLLLATQRPTGAVSPEIRANTNLRISLRVLDAADSSDVIEAPDAARIPKAAPGRGFARLGHAALSPFQSGRVGGRRPGVRSAEIPAPFVARLGWGQAGYAAPRPKTVDTRSDADVTDLSVLVTAIREANNNAGFAAQRRPWLDALPTSVLLDSLATPASTGDLPPVVFGLRDLPRSQVQVPAAFDLCADGHQYVIGGPRSGRSQYLRTFAAAAARTISTADLNLYGIDCGTGALLALNALPHTGAVIGRTENERATRLLARLTEEVARRQAVLAAGHFADVNEQRRAPGDAALPHIVLMIDRWEGFVTTLGALDNGKLGDQVTALLREGASVGVHVVITGDRTLVAARMSTLTENKLVLRLPDRNDYSLAGVPSRAVPEQIPAGRAFEGDEVLETQIALLCDDPEGAAQAAEVERVGQAARERDAGLPGTARPFRLDVLPTRIAYADVVSLLPAGRPLTGLIGVGGDEVAPCSIDLTQRGPTFLVAGPPKSGRSTALITLARSLLAGGTGLIVVTPRPSPLQSLERSPGVRALLRGSPTSEELSEFLDDDHSAAPTVVLIDDAEHLRDSPAKELLAGIARGSRGPGLAIVIGGATDGLGQGLSGWHVDVRKGKQGVLLSPQEITDGDLIGIRLPRSSIGGQIVPGRGLLHLGDNRPLTVQVPESDLAVLLDAS